MPVDYNELAEAFVQARRRFQGEEVNPCAFIAQPAANFVFYDDVQTQYVTTPWNQTKPKEEDPEYKDLFI